MQADFFDLQSILTNAASYVVVTRSSSASPHLNQFSAFAQDEWRISNSLTLSLGLRWEVNHLRLEPAEQPLTLCVAT